MRKYASLSPMFWVRGTGKRLRGCPEAQLVALYLMSCPAATMVGIFPLSLATLCNDTGLDREGALKGLARCFEEAFAEWDEYEELVWVPALPLHQVGERISVNKDGKKDYRHKAIIKALAPFKGHRFYSAFLARYGEPYLLDTEKEEAPSKPLARGTCPVPVPVPVNTDQDQPDRLGGKRERPRDPFGDSFAGKLPHQRADVQRVFAAYAETFAPGAKILRGDIRTDQIAECIDAHGEATCMLVVKYAPHDGMVSGKTDERGQKHESIGYIFGNPTTFERILKLAHEREGISKRRRSATELVREAQARRVEP